MLQIIDIFPDIRSFLDHRFVDVKIDLTLIRINTLILKMMFRARLLLIVDNRCSLDHALAGDGFLFKIIATMDIFNDLFIFILHVFYLFF